MIEQGVSFKITFTTGVGGVGSFHGGKSHKKFRLQTGLLVGVDPGWAFDYAWFLFKRLLRLRKSRDDDFIQYCGLHAQHDLRWLLAFRGNGDG